MYTPSHYNPNASHSSISSCGFACNIQHISCDSFCASNTYILENPDTYHFLYHNCNDSKIKYEFSTCFLASMFTDIVVCSDNITQI